MNNYEKQLAWARKRGLHLDSRIERKCVDGVWGLFAVGDIPAGTKLVSYPADKAIKPFSDDLYQKNTSSFVKNIHRAVVEYVQGEASDYYGHFLQFERLEDLKNYSFYFFTDQQIELLNSMNPFLGSLVASTRQTTRNRVQEVKALVPEIDEDDIVLVALNYISRAWDESNFLPVIDYANHSDRLGMMKLCKNGEHMLEARQNYKKGDQIFLSYGRKDMYIHALSYNYFDPAGAHFIHFGTRFTQQARTAFEKEVVKYTSMKFKLEVFPDGDVWHYNCMDMSVCFLEAAPSLGMIDYIKSNYFPTKAEWMNKQCSNASLAKRLLDIINIMLQNNRVDEFSVDELPSGLQRFYYLLQKEKKMLQANKEWVVDNFFL